MFYIKRSKRNGKVYLSEVETKRVNGKVVTKHLRYLGRETDGKTISLPPSPRCRSAK